jgi:hypothetical protein
MIHCEGFTATTHCDKSLLARRAKQDRDIVRINCLVAPALKQSNTQRPISGQQKASILASRPEMIPWLIDVH